MVAGLLRCLVRRGDGFCCERRRSRYGSNGGHCRRRAGRGARHLPDDLDERRRRRQRIEDLLGHGGLVLWVHISDKKREELARMVSASRLSPFIRDFQTLD